MKRRRLKTTSTTSLANQIDSVVTEGIYLQPLTNCLPPIMLCDPNLISKLAYPWAGTSLIQKNIHWLFVIGYNLDSSWFRTSSQECFPSLGCLAMLLWSDFTAAIWSFIQLDVPNRCGAALEWQIFVSRQMVTVEAFNEYFLNIELHLHSHAEFCSRCMLHSSYKLVRWT